MHVRGPLHWMAHNPVAANLLMLALVVAGFFSLKDIRQEVTPDFNLDGVRVSVAYPGASPEEVEEGIILAIERELIGLTGVDRVEATAREGSGSITAILADGFDKHELLNNVRSAVARITTFPDDAEPARVELRSHGFYVISVGIAGDLAYADLFRTSEQIRREILTMPGVAEVNPRGRKAPQINIEIPHARLRALDLSLQDVAGSIGDAARDVPAGNIQTADGEVLLRTQGRRDQASEFAAIAVKTAGDGAQVTVADIATLTDGFEAARLVYEFNGKPGFRLDVYQADNAHPVKLAKQVREYIDSLNAKLPDNIRVSVHNDRSKRYHERTELLLKNGAMGLTLVVLALGLFLNLRLAFWVAVSIPVVFLGSFTVLPYLDVSLNMISMFAFILTLGIVVDDAIIVGENIYARIQDGMPPGEAVTQGTREMLVPVTYAVGTNIIAFIPLLYVPGASGQFLRSLPIVACVVFTISLIEALFVLPAHLNHRAGPEKVSPRGWLAPFQRVARFHTVLAGSIERLRDGPYARLLQLALRERYLTVVLFIGALALVVAWFESGRIDLSWRPEIPGNRVDAEIEMPVDASIDETLTAVRHVEAAGLRALDKLGAVDQHLESWFVRAGGRRQTYGDVNLYLVPDAQRPFTQEELTRAWRDEVGDLPQVKSLFFEYLVGPGGRGAIRVNLSHASTDILEAAASELADGIAGIRGLVDISDGIAQGKAQITFTLTPQGRALGFTEQSLGRQLRNSFYGAEALRVLRNGNEVKVLVRLPASERSAIADISNLTVRSPDGIEVALREAANFTLGHAFSDINREDGKRLIRVTASVNKAVANSRLARASIENELLPELRARYPGLEAGFSGGRRDRDTELNAIFKGLSLVVAVIFILMAALFHSYVQGLIVVLTIPLAAAAAVVGHVLLGFDLSAVSIYGMIALCGLVVNGALVLTVRYNELRHRQPAETALLAATRSRFRPILLTSMTTTIGLLPMLFETSIQARFLVPMAIALSFGTLASMFVNLLFVPALHRIHDDVINWWQQDNTPSPEPRDPHG